MHDAEPTNLVQFLQTTVEKWPDRTFLGTKKASQFEWVTYREFGQRVDALRSGLAQLQVVAGTAVGIIANNRLEWAIAHFASLGRSARWVPMYEAELVATWEFIIRDSGIEVLFVSKPEIAEKVKQFADRVPSLRAVIMLEGDGEGTLSHLETRGRQHPVEVTAPKGDDVAVLIYTSGTTGEPKGVLLTHRNLVSNHFGRRRMFPELNETTRTLNILPWAHVYGMGEMHTLIQIGGSIGLAAIDTLLADFGAVRPTFVLAVPRVFNRVYNALWAKMNEAGGIKKWLFVSGVRAARRKRELAKAGHRSALVDAEVAVADRLVFSKIRASFGGRMTGAMTGSAAMSEAISQFFFDIGIPLYDVYGMTETSPGITLNCPSAHRSGSVGRPMEGVRVVIDTSVVEDGANDGEIIAYGPNVMKGYHNKPDATAAVLTADGGMRTGDRGRVDADGYLFITGRIKEQFKLENGKYVFPNALEEAIELHPMVLSSFIHGDGRPYAVGLLVLDPVAVKTYAQKHGLVDDYKAISARGDVQALVTSEVTAALKQVFGSYEVPKKYLFITEPFTVENGLLTHTMKLKRKQILNRYREPIDELYKTPIA